MAALCPHCNAKVSRIADHCKECGGKLTPDRPWYVLALGLFFVLMLFLWAVDFPALYRVMERWVGNPAP